MDRETIVAKSKDNELVIRQVRSTIGRPRKQREVLRGLGLRRPGHVVRRPDTDAVRGALRKVAHLVEVREAGDETAA